MLHAILKGYYEVSENMIPDVAEKFQAGDVFDRDGDGCLFRRSEHILFDEWYDDHFCHHTGYEMFDPCCGGQWLAEYYDGEEYFYF